ncbi:MAG: NADH:ubiquinone reductase (Na(+)-transporting) subunit D [Verrucomicrobia bacterium]|nr:NADH:ubiquinone reductase (Na(+)-transporting) subunit D [Verrucomicrobiota bacterium]
MADKVATKPALLRWFGTKQGATLLEQVWAENPIFRQILGICSALAVTNLMANTLIMCAGLVFANVGSNMIISALREYTPRRTRMITQVLIIATFVIIIDFVIKAFAYEASKQMGAYIGLIITNCIIMGRAEAFASKNTVGMTFLDALGSGLGYSVVLIAVALIREPLGFGTLFGFQVLPESFVKWQLMVLPPGAFICLGLLVWFGRAVAPEKVQ